MFDLTRLESLAKTKGISKTHLCSLVGRPKYYLNDIKNKVWAQTLNTTPEYLKGETDIKEKPADLVVSGKDKELLDLIEELTEEQRQMLILQVKGLLSDQ